MTSPSQFNFQNPQASFQTQTVLEQSKLFALQQPLKSRENKEELKKVANQFESLFIKQMLESMDKTIDRSSGFLSGGSGEEMFRGMLYEKISDSFASRPGGSGFGLASAIYKQMENRITAEDRSASGPSSGGTPDEAYKTHQTRVD